MTRSGVVVVGLEDSPASQAAHRWAAHYARTTCAVVHAVHVLKWPVGLAATVTESGTRLDVARRDVGIPYWRGMHRVYADVASPEGSGLRFAQGDVADVLVEISGEADLLVLGMTRLRRRYPALSSSVAGRCAATAACPVVTVPSPGPAHCAVRPAEIPQRRLPVRWLSMH